jgi:hypothetical protein
VPRDNWLALPRQLVTKEIKEPRPVLARNPAQVNIRVPQSYGQQKSGHVSGIIEHRSPLRQRHAKAQSFGILPSPEAWQAGRWGVMLKSEETSHRLIVTELLQPAPVR